MYVKMMKAVWPTIRNGIIGIVIGLLAVGTMSAYGEKAQDEFVLAYIIIWAIMAIIVMYVVFCMATSAHAVRKYIKENNLDLEEIKEDYKNALSFNDKYVFGKKYAFYSIRTKNYMVKSTDVLWVFRRVHTLDQYVYGVKVDSTDSYSVNVMLSTGKGFMIPASQDEQTNDILKYIKEMYPKIFMEYTVELKNLYVKDLPGFIELAEKRRNGEI